MYIRKYRSNVTYDELIQSEETYHIEYRKYRFEKIQSDDKVVNAFFVDRHHKNGPEIHYITEHARIVIINAYTKRLITVLNARPGQIARYFLACHLTIPELVMVYANYNKQQGFNI